MGLPTLRGGFVGGDDHRLVLDHVLVNRPSVEHALKLFTIVHRDLYQPLPLLMFSGEMAVARAFNLFHSGSQSGAWLFHLTNVLLHALVTIAVFLTVLMLHRRLRPTDNGTPMIQRPRWTHFRPAKDGANRAEHVQARSHSNQTPQSAVGTADSQSLAVATFAALLFAIHPLNVEVVAWINGRMMLLSTLFALCGILAFARWLDRPHWIDAALTVLCMVLSALSKVRVGLPLLLLLVAMMRGDWRKLRFWPVWIGAGALTALFAWINIDATAQADLFSEAAEHLQGPRAARVLLALDNYFTHVVWPVGLTSYYPTPPVVAWSDPQTLRAMFTVSVAACLLALCIWRVPAARWGVAWFFIALADTLPFIPARNVLAADRYLYLPLVGLFWTIVAVALRVYGYRSMAPSGSEPRTSVRTDPGLASAVKSPLQLRGVATMILMGIVPTLIGMSWYTARWYDNPELKTERVARVFPDVPRVWERYGWTLYSKGDYDQAIELAQREFVHDAPAVQSGAYQLIGMSRFKQGQTADALTALQKAVDIDPKNDLARFRLGQVFEDLGRFADALPLYEACVRSATSHNPTLHRLAYVYRELGRPADARRMYEQEMKNNPFEVPASLALADLDFQEGTPESVHAAKQRLVELLNWMPENVTARVNLAHLYDTQGDWRQALEQYSRALEYGFESMEQAGFAHDFFESHEHFEMLTELWDRYTKTHPGDSNAKAFLAWSLLVGGQTDSARAQIAGIGTAARSIVMAQATVALLALHDGRDDVVRSLADRLATSGDSASRQRLLRALERFDNANPGIAWTYYLTAAMLQADGQRDAARAFLELFTKSCSGPSCGDAGRVLAAKLQP